MEDKLIYPELSYKIIGVSFEVSNEIGPDCKEKHYQRAIVKAFKREGIEFQEQVPVEMKFQEQKIGIYFLDFLVEKKMILEIKRGEHFSKNNIKQVYDYLKATDLKLGLLVNFTNKGVMFKRIVNLY